MLHGTEYPIDLSLVNGIWQDPLPPFSNLIAIDMDLPSAIYWLFPVLSASANCAAFLRRIILRNIHSKNSSPFSFSFRELDLQLAEFPLVHVLLIYPPEDYFQIIEDEMRITHHSKRLHNVRAGEYTFL